MASILSSYLNVHLHTKHHTSLFLRMCSELAETGHSERGWVRGSILFCWERVGGLEGLLGMRKARAQLCVQLRKRGPRALGEGMGAKACPLRPVTPKA